MDVNLRVAANGQDIHLSVAFDNAALQGDVSLIKEGEGIVVGSIRHHNRLVQIQIVKPAAPKEEPEKKSEKIQL